MDDSFILFVEDNPNDVDLTLIALKEREFPYQVNVVRDGAEALDFLFGVGKYAGRDKTRTPLLILLDLNLPKVHGLEVLRRLKADPLLRQVVVVILTSSNEQKDQVQAEALGANLYIQKPVNFDEFEQVIERIEGYLEAFQENRVKLG